MTEVAFKWIRKKTVNTLIASRRWDSLGGNFFFFCLFMPFCTVQIF